MILLIEFDCFLVSLTEDKGQKGRKEKGTALSDCCMGKLCLSVGNNLKTKTT
jgi:hypothetical protein